MTEITFNELAPIEDLVPNPGNPKEITEESIIDMMALLQTFGFRDPIEARAEDGLIVAGHRRYLAATRLALTHVPVVWHHGLSDEEALAYTIAHTQAEKHVAWNRPLLADHLGGLGDAFSPDVLGFSEKDVGLLFDLDRGVEDAAEDGQTEGDEEPPAAVQPGEVWVIGPCTFNVYNNLDNSQLRKAESAIRKIGKLVKAEPLLEGREDQPLKLIAKERANG